MRPEKQLLLDQLKGQIEASPSFVLLRYQKLSANTANSFRSDIALKGGNVEFVRKRVFLRALQSCGISLDEAMMAGHVGVVFSGNEPLDVAKIVVTFSKENGDSVEIAGGLFDNQVIQPAQVEALSQLPGRDEMRARLLATFEAPMAQLLAVFEAALSSVPYCLDGRVRQQEGAKEGS